MTQNQLEWMQRRGLDPAEYDMTLDGRVIRRQVAVAAEPQREVMSPLRAAGTSFLGNVLPSAAGLGGAKLGMMAGAPFGPVGVGLGAIGGGLGAGYLTGKGQEAVLERVAPEALEEMRRAATDQPVMSYLGGFAPNALAFRPSVQGMSGLLRPAGIRGTETLREALSKPEFLAPAMNVGVNVAGSTAGQLVNMSQGGEFSAPRFAADVALGTLFNRPTALGRRFGFQDIPEPRREAPGDLAAARERAEFMEYPPSEFVTPREERLDLGAEEVAPEQFFTSEGKRMTEKAMARDYTNWWKSETEPTTDLIKAAAESVKIKLPKERLEELSRTPEVFEVIKDPTKLPEFIAREAEYTLQQAYEDAVRLHETSERFLSAEDAAIQQRIMERYGRQQAQKGTPEYLAQAMGAGRERSMALTPEGGTRVAPEGWTPEAARPVRAAATTEEVLGRAPEGVKAEEGVPLQEALKPTPEEAAKAEAIQAENARIEAEQNAAELRKLQDLEAAQALSDEAAARLQSLQARQAELLKLAERTPAVMRRAIRGDIAPEITQAKQELANARAIAEDIYSRLQRAPADYSNRITQEDINLATEIANRRGLRIELDRAYAGDQQVRGLFMVDPKTGDRIIRINPLMATPDTAIHEIGHDVFKGVTNKGMRRSLLDTAMDSPAYKAELAARAKEVKAGKISEQEANDIALEEGLIQAFGEQMPSVKRSELRAWYQAFKASMKQLVTGKMSPEDALAWMHYATTEAVPWKGVAVAKATEQRMQRGEDIAIHYGDLGYGRDTVLGRMGGRSTGHFGTGTYFLSEGRVNQARSDRPIQKVSFEGYNLFRPSTESEAFALHGGLKDVNNLTTTLDELNKIRQEKPSVDYDQEFIDYSINELENRLTTKSENAARTLSKVLKTDIAPQDVINIVQEAVNDPQFASFRSVYADSASTRLMKSLGYEGVDVRHLPELDNTSYGSVIYGEKFSPKTVRYQRAQQETPEFKAWFGDSKVVDAEGKPLTVYTGTSKDVDFTSFKAPKNGIWFAIDPEVASTYAMQNDSMDYKRTPGTWKLERTNTASRVIPAYVSLKNPAMFEVWPDVIRYATNYKKALGDYFTQLKAQGHDGVIFGSGKDTVYVAFKPEQVKSSLANRGTFSPESKDIRYQRGLGSEIVRPSELDYLASKGGPFERVATPMRAAYNTRDFKAGEWSSKYSLAAELRPEDQKRLFMHLAQEFDNNTRSTPPADLRAAYDQIRNEYLPAIVNDYNAAGMTVRDTAGLRARGSNPTYIPLHAIDETVKDILTTKQGSPEYDKLKNDFLQWNTQLRQADGASLAEAQKYALDKFEEKVDITSKPPGIESGIPFSGARKPEGYPLPPSWRSDDLIGNLNNYTRRSATDYAYQKHVESSPEAMAALGAKKYFNDQPIPANILASTANVINEPSVQSILREYRGTPAQKVGGNVADVGRMVTVATIGPVSKVGDIGTSLVKGLVYLPAGEYTSGLVDFTNRLGDWAALKERSYASGLNKRDAAQNMRQVLGIGDDSVSFMAKAAETLSKFTGLNQLETVARTIAQGWGETVVKYNKRLALSGDKNATQMLDTLSPDWRTRSDADLAAQVGRLLQGSYDMRQLPASVLEGAAAPYLTWSKWSIGQYDSFMKYALRPAMQGNVKPLIGQMLIGVLGGGAVAAVQEWINNREGKDITWNELESWMQQNQGQLGADGGQLLGQKLLTMAQKLGTFGFAGDVAKMVVDTAAGGTAQGVATMPALDAVYDVSKRVAAATKALDDGEDFGLVLKALMQDSVIGHLQVARLARNWLDEDENMRYDDRRRRRLYDELTGMPSKGGAFAVNYSNLSEREFERGEITPQTGEEAMSLVMRAREQATTPEDYASRIRKLKTSQNAIMPSLERQPLKAARYLSWLEGTEEGLGSETMRRYLIREQEDKYRKSLVEGMSGIR